MHSEKRTNRTDYENLMPPAEAEAVRDALNTVLPLRALEANVRLLQLRSLRLEGDNLVRCAASVDNLVAQMREIQQAAEAAHGVTEEVA